METEHPQGIEPEEERRLIAAARTGDRTAYGRLVEAFRERCFAAALSLLNNEEDARDMSQDAFIKAFRALDRFDAKRPFYPWLYRILRNGCLNHLKRHGSHRKVSLDALTEVSHLQFEAKTEDPVESIQAEQMAVHLHEAIGQLKPEFREIILMKHFQEMSYEEIAQALGIPIGTVMSRLFHARRGLAKLMEPHRDR